MLQADSGSDKYGVNVNDPSPLLKLLTFSDKELKPTAEADLEVSDCYEHTAEDQRHPNFVHPSKSDVIMGMVRCLLLGPSAPLPAALSFAPQQCLDKRPLERQFSQILTFLTQVPAQQIKQKGISSVGRRT